ncbi:carboxy terminal-processing peptidase [Flavihumibacter profundi]|uniref:carboxy terminal-processing peptidase n=1 Tax=Flavihumibacter profundi TaxID=2716883 RepID=UPI001CC41494|nr:carboxy terminal-processing peptidase [Flavihumibacter profundi]MBZ5855845.1 carboxy terminal-processing peptidase [Flavihumibacter profundi]
MLIAGISNKHYGLFVIFGTMQKLVDFMFSKRSLPVLVIMLSCALFIGFRSMGTNGTHPPGKYEKILHNVGDILLQVHYSPKKLDDAFSKEVFTKFLTTVDGEKNIFLQSDIQSLRKYETKLDDEINGGDVEFVPAVSLIFKNRVLETEQLAKELLEKPFEFKTEENITLDPENLEFPKNEAEKKDRWRKRLKYMALERYSDLLDIQEKSKGKPDYVAKTNTELEKDARDKVQKVVNRMFDRLKLKYSDDDRFNQYVNTITSTMDPHTTFFPPVDKRYFDEQMSGRFFGIGASLREEDGNIKIASLLTGSPAWKSGEVTVGDIVLKVGQGAEEPTDLAGSATEDAVKIIRGKKGTEVRLTLRKNDGSIKVVSLIRDEIVQDETFARSAIVNNGKSKIGFIYLPEFYADFDNPKGNRCAIDVAKEIIKLKEQKIDGIVMDLRNNGGGSLYDVVQMVGLFIEDGPIVQVRDRDGKPSVLRDRDKSVLYDGPLAVMVNEFSASASEIFAAAIQDYKRGVIIGSSTTYGKGTVQRNIGLDKESGMFTSNSELGTIKLTLQKFYRINGGSTQLKGVSSDIVIPDVLEKSKLREKDDPDALPWDEIQKSPYTTWKAPYDIDVVSKNSQLRVNNNPAFNLIKTNTDWLAEQNDKTYSLNLEKYRDSKKKINATVKQLESLNKLSKEIVVEDVPGSDTRFSTDTDKLERYKAWKKGLTNDIYLDEALNAVNDMVYQKNLAFSKAGEQKVIAAEKQ